MSRQFLKSTIHYAVCNHKTYTHRGVRWVEAPEWVPLSGRKRDVQRADGVKRMCVAVTDDYGALSANIFRARCVGTTEKPLGTRYSVGVPRRCVSRPPRHRGRRRSNRLKRRRPSAVLPFRLWKPAGRRKRRTMLTENQKFLFIYSFIKASGVRKFEDVKKINKFTELLNCTTKTRLKYKYIYICVLH